MAAQTYAQRLDIVERLHRAGLGLVATTQPGAGGSATDYVAVKDPDHVIATAGGATPIAGQINTNTWVLWAGDAAATAYGV